MYFRVHGKCNVGTATCNAGNDFHFQGVSICESTLTFVVLSCSTHPLHFLYIFFNFVLNFFVSKSNKVPEILFQKDLARFHKAAQLRTDADEVFLRLLAADETFDEHLSAFQCKTLCHKIYIFFIFHQRFSTTDIF